jgi:hypothetical protein
MQKTPHRVRDLYAITPALSVVRQDMTVFQLFGQEVLRPFGKIFPVIPKEFLSPFIGIG